MLEDSVTESNDLIVPGDVGHGHFVLLFDVAVVRYSLDLEEIGFAAADLEVLIQD